MKKEKVEYNFPIFTETPYSNNKYMYLEHPYDKSVICIELPSMIFLEVYGSMEKMFLRYPSEKIIDAEVKIALKEKDLSDSIDLSECIPCKINKGDIERLKKTAEKIEGKSDLLKFNDDLDD